MILNLRVCVAAVLATVFLLLRPAWAADAPTELKAVIDGAAKEGALSLQYAENIMGGTQGAQVAAAGIKKMFGVSLDVNFTPGPSFATMASKLYTEMQAGQKASTDVYNGTAVQVYPFLARGLFRKIEWTKLYPGRITPKIAEADGRALRIVEMARLSRPLQGPQAVRTHWLPPATPPRMSGIVSCR